MLLVGRLEVHLACNAPAPVICKIPLLGDPA